MTEKIYDNKSQCLEAKLYMEKIIDDCKMDKVYGGFEGKLEGGKVVHFKHWVSKKL